MSTAAPNAETIDPAIGTPSKFHGEILDADGHMYLLPEVAAKIYPGLEPSFVNKFLSAFTQSEQYGLDRERNRSELWNVKGIGALGAFDPVERLEALELMGIKSQLIFPNNQSGESTLTSEAAYNGMRSYNDYAIDFQNASKGRARMVLQMNMTDPELAIKELDRVIKKGARALNLQANVPPGDVSPSHELWDPFWARCEEADVVPTLHLGTGGLLAARTEVEMFPNRNWGNSASLKGKPVDRAGGEEAISPYFMLVAHMPAELYMQTLVMGQVFERFPKLRFGLVELGAKWFGPMAERMDLWADFMGKVGRNFPMKPSEYLRRNVRITPFWHENLPLMIERYGLQECYCYSTDYPHLEGSRDPVGKFKKWLDKLPPEYERDFYVENAKLIFPGA